MKDVFDMSEREMKLIDYMVICISEFAKKKGISKKDAYNYLKEYKGLEFLDECYEAEHTVSLNDAIDDLTRVCKGNGGTIE